MNDAEVAGSGTDPRTPLPSLISRRRLLGGAAATAGALVVGFGATKVARATDIWVVAAGASGYLNGNWHGDSWFGSSCALDIDSGELAEVAIYSRISGTGTYGYYWCVEISDSCEEYLNPGQKKIRFAIGTNSNFNSVFGYCGYMHVFPSNINVNDTGLAYESIAFVGDGRVSAGSTCYTGPHLHQTANGIHMADPAGEPASKGNTEYWYWNA